jgi:hypothetical protein
MPAGLVSLGSILRRESGVFECKLMLFIGENGRTGEEQFTDRLRQQAVRVEPLDSSLLIHEYRAQVRRIRQSYSGVDKLLRVPAHGLGHVLRNEPQQLVATRCVRVLNDDNASRESFARGHAKGQFAKVDYWNRPAAQVKDARHAFRGLREFFYLNEGQHFHYPVGFQGITIVSKFEDKEKH